MGGTKCERCRRLRQKCQYDDLDLSCNLCKERGLSCTAEDKGWGPEKGGNLNSNVAMLQPQHVSIISTFRRPQSPDYERLNSADRMALQQFHTLWPPSCWGPLLFRSRLGSSVGIHLYNVGLDSHLSASFRSAVLVFMSNYNKDDYTTTLNNLIKYHRGLQKAINGNAVSTTEVVSATYVVAVYSLIGGDSMQLAINKCRDLCGAIKAFTMSSMISDEWIETLWQHVLSSLYHVHRDVIFFIHRGTPFTETFEQLHQVLDVSACALPSNHAISNLPLTITTEQICTKIKSLSVYLQYYLDEFLFRVTYQTGIDRVSSLKAELRSILDRIMRLISHLSNISDFIRAAYSNLNFNYYGPKTSNTFLHFPRVRPRGLQFPDRPKDRDTVLSLLYTFARLLNNMLDPMADANENIKNDINSSAIALCRLCATFPDLSSTTPMVTLIVKRSLHWAGMILTETNYFRAHVWIKSRLRQCIHRGHHWRNCVLVPDEEEFIEELMRQSDRRNSFDDIWTLTAANISFFYYNTTLAPWFFALNLAKFGYTPNGGRRLRIIQ